MKNCIKFIILCVVIYFLGNYLIENWNKIDKYKYDTNWYYLSISFLSLLGSLLILPISLQNIIRLFKYKILFKKICIILFYSQCAKYLPGGVWGYLGRVYLYKKEGMSAGDAAKSVLLETVLILLSGIFISLCSLFFIESIPLVGWVSNKYIRFTGIIVLILLLLVIHPKILNRIMDVMPYRMKPNSFKFNYKYRSILKPALYLIFFWLCVGISFWLFIRSFIYIDLKLLPMITGIFVISWIIGLLVFISPGGLGAREACLVLFLNLYLPFYFSTFIAVAARVWWVIGEFVWGLLVYVWARSGREEKKSCFRISNE